MGIKLEMLFSFCTLMVSCMAVPVAEPSYKLEIFQHEGDTQSLTLKLTPNVDPVPKVTYRKPRQEDEDEDENVPSTTPFIPAVIPGLTKIFSGILTGNLNQIFHGSTSFAPQNVSHAIDTVYNQVVGLPPPRSTVRPGSVPASTRPPAPPPPVSAAPTAAASAPTQAASSSGVAAGQPLATQAPIAATTKSSSNEDDEDESEGEGFGGFRRSRIRSHN